MGIIKFILKTLKVKSSSKSYNVKQQEKIFSDAKRPIHIEFQERIGQSTVQFIIYFSFFNICYKNYCFC